MATYTLPATLKQIALELIQNVHDVVAPIVTKNTPVHSKSPLRDAGAAASSNPPAVDVAALHYGFPAERPETYDDLKTCGFINPDVITQIFESEDPNQADYLSACRTYNACIALWYGFESITTLKTGVFSATELLNNLRKVRLEKTEDGYDLIKANNSTGSERVALATKMFLFHFQKLNDKTWAPEVDGDNSEATAEYFSQFLTTLLKDKQLLGMPPEEAKKQKGPDKDTNFIIYLIQKITFFKKFGLDPLEFLNDILNLVNQNIEQGTAFKEYAAATQYIDDTVSEYINTQDGIIDKVNHDNKAINSSIVSGITATLNNENIPERQYTGTPLYQVEMETVQYQLGRYDKIITQNQQILSAKDHKSRITNLAIHSNKNPDYTDSEQILPVKAMLEQKKENACKTLDELEANVSSDFHRVIARKYTLVALEHSIYNFRFLEWLFINNHFDEFSPDHYKQLSLWHKQLSQHQQLVTKLAENPTQKYNYHIYYGTTYGIAKPPVMDAILNKHQLKSDDKNKHVTAQFCLDLCEQLLNQLSLTVIPDIKSKLDMALDLFTLRQAVNLDNVNACSSLEKLEQLESEYNSLVKNHKILSIEDYLRSYIEKNHPDLIQAAKDYLVDSLLKHEALPSAFEKHESNLTTASTEAKKTFSHKKTEIRLAERQVNSINPDEIATEIAEQEKTLQIYNKALDEIDQHKKEYDVEVAKINARSPNKKHQDLLDQRVELLKEIGLADFTTPNEELQQKIIEAQKEKEKASRLLEKLEQKKQDHASLKQTVSQAFEENTAQSYETAMQAVGNSDLLAADTRTNLVDILTRNKTAVDWGRSTLGFSVSAITQNIRGITQYAILSEDDKIQALDALNQVYQNSDFTEPKLKEARRDLEINAINLKRLTKINDALDIVNTNIDANEKNHEHLKIADKIKAHDKYVKKSNDSLRNLESISPSNSISNLNDRVALYQAEQEALCKSIPESRNYLLELKPYNENVNELEIELENIVKKLDLAIVQVKFYDINTIKIQHLPSEYKKYSTQVNKVSELLESYDSKLSQLEELKSRIEASDTLSITHKKYLVDDCDIRVLHHQELHKEKEIACKNLNEEVRIFYNNFRELMGISQSIIRIKLEFDNINPSLQELTKKVKARKIRNHKQLRLSDEKIQLERLLDTVTKLENDPEKNQNAHIKNEIAELKQSVQAKLDEIQANNDILDGLAQSQQTAGNLGPQQENDPNLLRDSAALYKSIHESPAGRPISLKENGNYQGIQLSDVQIRPETLKAANFENASLSGCHFTVTERPVDGFKNVNCKKADLSTVEISGTVPLKGIIIDQETQLNPEHCQRIITENVLDALNDASAEKTAYLDNLLTEIAAMPANQSNQENSAITANFILELLSSIGQTPSQHPKNSKQDLLAKKQLAASVVQKLTANLSYQELLKLTPLIDTKHDGDHNPYGYIRRERDRFRFRYGNTNTWKTIMTAIKAELAKSKADVQQDEYNQYSRLMRTDVKHHYGFGFFPRREAKGEHPQKWEKFSQRRTPQPGR